MNRFSRASRRAGAVIAVVVALTATAACTASTQAVDPTAGTEFRFTDATAKGELIPVADRKKPGDVTGQLLGDSGTYRLADDLGQVVVVNLWAAWCGPCKVETPQFEQVYQDMKDQGVTFVGFDVKDDEGAAQDFVTDNRITYPIVFDQAVKVALQFGDLPVQVGLPQTVLVDRQGRVAAAYVGITKPSELTPALDTLVAES